jgi:hypothetical protein
MMGTITGAFLLCSSPFFLTVMVGWDNRLAR